MSHLNKVSITALLLTVLLLPRQASAQETQPTSPIKFPNPVIEQPDLAPQATPSLTLVASVEIKNAQISRENDLLKVSFDMVNEGNHQSAVRNTIRLVPSDVRRTIAVDEQVMPETYDIPAHSTVHKELSYKIPSSLWGEYLVLVTAGNINGFPLATTSAGKLNLSASGGVAILSETCTTEGSGTKKPLGQPLVLDHDQQVALTCMLENTSVHPVTVTSSFVTRVGSVYGAAVTTSTPEFEPIILNASERKIVRFVVPVAQDPQLYNVALQLIGGATANSNTVMLQYGINGPMANVLNFSFDNTTYKSKDTATTMLVAAASVPVTATVTLASGGKTCADPFTAESSTSLTRQVYFKMNRACAHPVATVTLADSQGAVLAQQAFAAGSTDKPAGRATLPIIIVIALVVIAALVIRGRMSRTLTIIIGLTAALLGVTQTQAATYYVGSEGATYINISQDRHEYSPSDAMYVWGSVQNWSQKPDHINITASTSGVSARTIFDSPLWYYSTHNISASIPVAGAPGDYNMDFGVTLRENEVDLEITPEPVPPTNLILSTGTGDMTFHVKNNSSISTSGAVNIYVYGLSDTTGYWKGTSLSSAWQITGDTGNYTVFTTNQSIAPSATLALPIRVSTRYSWVVGGSGPFTGAIAPYSGGEPRENYDAKNSTVIRFCSDGNGTYPGYCDTNR